MTTLTLQQAYEACQTNKTAWLNRKAELAAAVQEYQELLLDDNASGSRGLQLRIFMKGDHSITSIEIG